MNIGLIQGAHFETPVWVYLLQNIFPELNIPRTEPWKYKQTSDKSIIVSANLDCGKIKGHRNGGMYYELTSGNKTPIIFYTGEPYDVHVNSSTGKHKYLIISSLKHQIEDNVFHIPFAFMWYTHFYLNKYLHKFRDTPILGTYFLGYCATRKTNTRTEFMTKITNNNNNNKNIICYGVDNNYTCIKKIINRTPAPNFLLVKEYSTCNFVLTFENCEKQGYITEKIICAFISGAIPIYLGDHNYAKELFNPKAFICVRDFDSFDCCIEYIVNMNDQDILSMKKEPMFTDNIVPDIFKVDDFSDNTIYGKLKKHRRAWYDL